MSGGATTEGDEATLEEFRSFFHAKAFDVIGNGSYRKHLARCRASWDRWAVAMGTHVHSMQARIRQVQQAVANLPRGPYPLATICRDAMMSAQAPIRICGGGAVCAITGVRCARCLDLSKTHKGGATVYVDERFCHFFMLLWYCNKLEYIIRCYTRTWLETRLGAEEESFRDLCEALAADMEPTVAQMHRLFCVGVSHVSESLRRYAAVDGGGCVLVAGGRKRAGR